MKKIDKAIFLFILIVIIISSYLAIIDIFSVDTPFCLTGKSCDIVKNSIYSTLLGIKLSFIGLFYSIVLVVSFLLKINKKLDFEYFTLISGIGAVFAVYFLYIQLFIIGKICTNCVIVDVSIIIIFILTLVKNNKNSPPG